MSDYNTHSGAPVALEDSVTTSQNDIITVVRDQKYPLGKGYELKPDGLVVKSSNVKLSFGLAQQHYISTSKELKKLLEDVGNDSHAAIINSRFPSIPVGEEFAILSRKKMDKRLNIPASDRDKQKGIHQIEVDGKTLKAVCRLKENMSPSSWVLIDRDIDKHTPEKFAELDRKDFLIALDDLIPGIKDTTLVTTQSSSARVMKDGQPISAGNGHLFFKVNDPDGIDRLRKIILAKAIEVDMAWVKLRYSKTEPKKIVAKSWATIIDHSVWNLGRLVFCGKPTISKGLELEPLSIEIRIGMSKAVDTAAITFPDISKVQKLSRDAGTELSISEKNGVISNAANDLKLDTEIETQDFGTITVSELVKRNEAGKVRCQAPFRDSTSWAAFYSINEQGIPFVHDSGTSITHWLNPFQHDDVKIIKASAIVDRLLNEVVEDSAAALEDEAIEALAQIQKADPAEYQRKRAKLKQKNSSVSLSTIDRMVKTSVPDGMPNTHHGYAKSLLQNLTYEKWRPVGHNGTLHVAESTTGLWLPKFIDELQRTVAEAYDGQENCKRSQDYRAIAGHATSLADKGGFFDGAPIGIACPGGFYRIEAGKIKVEPLSPDHRQRYSINVEPADQPTPLFNKFLHETFMSANDSEEDQQRHLLQEIFGAVMLGLMPQFQKAVLFYEPYGRAGKGTVERILNQLVPNKYVTAISPFNWYSDYHLAALAGSRFNVVGELPDNKSIPAAEFKSLIGGDLVTGRNPTHRPFTFKNEAAHLFMSNHFINTRDYSEAFFTRWILLEFPNSRLRSGLPIDVDLADNVINAEMPGIAFWALEGARRLLESSNFSSSITHDRLMGEWRRNRNSLEQFIHECCKLGADAKVKRSEFYVAYTTWCGDVGKKPFAKSKVKDILEHTIGWKIRHSRPNGIETFYGVGIIDEGFGPLVG